MEESVTYQAILEEGEVLGEAKGRVEEARRLLLRWDLDDDPDGNVMHIAEHGIAKDEVAEVLSDPLAADSSHSSGRPIAMGLTSTGRKIVVVYEEIDAITVYPVTAYEID